MLLNHVLFVEGLLIDLFFLHYCPGFPNTQLIVTHKHTTGMCTVAGWPRAESVKNSFGRLTRGRSLNLLCSRDTQTRLWVL